MIELTEMNNGYDGKPTRLEVSALTPDVGQKYPALYLQHVEGCGYYVLEMTAEQAETLAQELLDGAKESREAFPEKEDNQ